MDIQPRAFLHAKQSIDYFTKVFEIDLDEDLYKFHIYNLAVVLNMQVVASDGLIDRMAAKDNFLDIINDFSDEWSYMYNNSHNA